MNIEQPQVDELNILCIGEVKSGKTILLQKLTKEKDRTQDKYHHIPYKLFVKRINGILTYFHELSDKQEVYLLKKYNAVIFFIDVASARANNKIIKWMDLYSSLSQQDVYNIPIKVIITNTNRYANQHLVLKWKKHLEKQLQKVVTQEQILYLSSVSQANKEIKNFCNSVILGKQKGIKQTYRNQWKIYGFDETLKLLWQNFQYYFIYRNEGGYLYVDKNMEQSELSSLEQQDSQKQNEQSQN